MSELIERIMAAIKDEHLFESLSTGKLSKDTSEAVSYAETIMREILEEELSWHWTTEPPKPIHADYWYVRFGTYGVGIIEIYSDGGVWSVVEHGQTYDEGISLLKFLKAHPNIQWSSRPIPMSEERT